MHVPSDPLRADPPTMDPGTDIGHVHLKAADLDRALGFYQGVLDLDPIGRLGDQAAFLSAGGYHHHIGLNTWESRGGSPPPRGTTGLYHVAIRYPTRPALARALHALIERHYPIEGAADHAVSEAIYLRDPTGTASSRPWTDPATNGRSRRTAATRWWSRRSISRVCSRRRVPTDRRSGPLLLVPLGGLDAIQHLPVNRADVISANRGRETSGARTRT
jgi:catechol 2,3-dioxygenase